jgi:septal ring factor EnvC (AmiA/AmiB activator)
MRFYVLLFMAFLLTPTLSYAECNTPIDCYKQAISDLQNARAEIDKLREQAAKDAKTIKNLRESAKETNGQIKALLTQLDTTAEQVAKLTEAVSVSEDGKVGIGTTNPKAKLDVNGNIKAQSFEGQIKAFSHLGVLVGFCG